jgi:hypothetical protein
MFPLGRGDPAHFIDFHWRHPGLYWPFTHALFTRRMEHFSRCQIKDEKFRITYLPHPGYVVEGVTLFRPSGGRVIRMASVSKMECVGSWLWLITFQYRVKEIRLNGLCVFISRPVPPPLPLHGSVQERTEIASSQPTSTPS